jgi:hypothetical protein
MLLGPYNDQIGDNLEKRRENLYVQLKTWLVFVFPCYYEIGTNQVTVQAMRTERTVSFYF